MQEVCALAYNHGRSSLVSGADDNALCVLGASAVSLSVPTWSLSDHQIVVKAPHERKFLESGC